MEPAGRDHASTTSSPDPESPDLIGLTTFSASYEKKPCGFLVFDLRNQVEFTSYPAWPDDISGHSHLVPVIGIDSRSALQHPMRRLAFSRSVSRKGVLVRR